MSSQISVTLRLPARFAAHGDIFRNADYIPGGVRITSTPLYIVSDAVMLLSSEDRNILLNGIADLLRAKMITCLDIDTGLPKSAGDIATFTNSCSWEPADSSGNNSGTGGGGGRELTARSVTPRDVTFLQPSKNLFDKSKATLHEFLGHDGTTGTTPGFDYDYSDFIAVTAGATYTASTSMRFTTYFNSAKAFVAGGAQTTDRITIPAGVAFVRVTFPHSSIDTFQFELGAVSTSFVPFGFTLTGEDGTPIALTADQRVPADRSITAQKIAQRAITPMETNFLQRGKNLFNKASATIGYFLGDEGSLVANAGFDYSDFIPVTPGVTYTGRGIGNNMRFTTYYDADKRLVAGGAHDQITTFTVPAGVAFVRVTLIHADLDSFQLEVGSTATAFEAFGFSMAVDDGSPVFSVPAPRSTTTERLALRAVTPLETNFLQPGKNLFNKSKAVIGYFLGDGGGVVQHATFDYSDFIPVTPGVTYTGRGASTSMRFTTYYNAAKGVVGGGSNSQIQTFTVPAGVAFVRVTLNHTDLASFQFEAGSTPTAFEAFGFTLVGQDGEVFTVPGVTASVAVSLWFAKKWSTLGDSLTQGLTWQPSVATALGLVHTGYGLGGSRISGSAGSTTAMCQDTRINAIPTDQDLVTVMGGTNDFAQNVALGAVDSADPNTFNGALNVMLTKLLTRFPTKRIALFTTPWGERLDFASAGWANGYTNTLGLTCADYSSAIRAACLRWGVPCVDVQGKCGWNTVNIRTYITDDGGLFHPNTVGGRRIAEVTIGELKRIEPLI
jgi:lysophospholipase L1-like esterase